MQMPSAFASTAELATAHGLDDVAGKTTIGMKYSDYLNKLVNREARKLREQRPEWNNSDASQDTRERVMEAAAKEVAFMRALDASLVPGVVLQREGQIRSRTWAFINHRWTNAKRDLGRGKLKGAIDPDLIVRKFLASNNNSCGVNDAAKIESGLTGHANGQGTKRKRDGEMEVEDNNQKHNGKDLLPRESDRDAPTSPKRSRPNLSATVEDCQDLEDATQQLEIKDGAAQAPAPAPVVPKPSAEPPAASTMTIPNASVGKEDMVSVCLYEPALACAVEPLVCIGVAQISAQAVEFGTLIKTLERKLDPLGMHIGHTEGTHAIIYSPTNAHACAVPPMLIESDDELQYLYAHGTDWKHVDLIFCERASIKAVLSHLTLQIRGK